MVIDVSKENLHFFEALASDVRMEILSLLAKREMNVKELAEAIGVSSSIMAKHVRKLEDAGLIQCRRVSRDGFNNKLCTLLDAEYRLQMPVKAPPLLDMYEVSMPVGQYTDILMNPTCGMATETEIIGQLDDPRIIYDPQRAQAQILWLTQGYVEYKFPNYIAADQQVKGIEISLELSSEAPGHRDIWPSDISFSLAGVHLFDWTSPGDFGERRGVNTPVWWNANQYGLLKTIRINGEGTFLDNVRCSPLTIGGIPLKGAADIRFRMEVKEDARYVGGLTVYGRQFGDFQQDIVMRVFCRKNSESANQNNG